METKTECRVCLKGEGNIPIFGDDENPDISWEVKIFGNIQLHKEDEFPKALCKGCSELLENAIAFRKSALRADALLQLRSQRGISKPSGIVIVGADDDSKINAANVHDPDVSIVKTETAQENISQVTDSNPELEYLSDYLDIVWLKEAKNIDTNDNIQTENVSKFETGIESSLKHNEQLLTPQNQPESMEVVNNVGKKECPVCKKMLLPYYWARHQKTVHGIDVNNYKKSPRQKDRKKECPACKEMILPYYWPGHLKDIHGLDIHMSLMPINESSKIPSKCPELDITKPPIKEENNESKKVEKALPFDFEYNIKVEEDEKHIQYNKLTQENQQEKHSNNKKDPVSKKQCPKCKEMFLPQHWTRHMKAKHGIITQYEPAPQTLIQCQHCLKMIKKRCSCMYKKTHDHFVCEVCGHTSSNSHQLERHRATHSNDLPYHCEHCPYRGRSKDLLAVHMRTHTRDDRYKCTQCGTCHLTKSNLTRHMRTHQKKSGDFACDSCGSTYYSKLKLERHIEYKHLGIKRHVCVICGSAYGCKSVLRKHERQVHKRAKKLGRPKATYLKVLEEEEERRNQQADTEQ